MSRETVSSVVNSYMISDMFAKEIDKANDNKNKLNSILTITVKLKLMLFQIVKLIIKRQKVLKKM